MRPPTTCAVSTATCQFGKHATPIQHPSTPARPRTHSAPFRVRVDRPTDRSTTTVSAGSRTSPFDTSGPSKYTCYNLRQPFAVPHLDAPAMLPDLHHRIAYALIACALGAAGCGGGDRATAAITPSIRLSRNVVPLGGPVDATLQFYVPPNTAPFSEDDRVLLDLTFDDGE